jgi:pyridoxine 4-dehydrogenase
VIATKGGLTRSGPNQWDADGRPEYLRKACEASLARLKIDRIPSTNSTGPIPRSRWRTPSAEIVKLKDEGKIRHIGICNVTETELHRAQGLTPIVSVQNRYNVADRSSESMVDLCEQERIAFLPWAPILDIDEDGAVAEIARTHDCTHRQVVLAWLLARSPNILPIPGTGIGRSPRSERRRRRDHPRASRDRGADSRKTLTGD